MNWRLFFGIIATALLVPVAVVASVMFQYGGRYDPTAALALITVFSAISLAPIAYLTASRFGVLRIRLRRILGSLVLVPVIALLAVMAHALEWDLAVASDSSSTSVLILGFMVAYSWVSSLLLWFVGFIVVWLFRRRADAPNQRLERTSAR